MTNTRTALGLSLIVLTMITLVAFSVPLYDYLSCTGMVVRQVI